MGVVFRTGDKKPPNTKTRSVVFILGGRFVLGEEIMLILGPFGMGRLSDHGLQLLQRCENRVVNRTTWYSSYTDSMYKESYVHPLHRSSLSLAGNSRATGTATLSRWALYTFTSILRLSGEATVGCDTDRRLQPCTAHTLRNGHLRVP